PLSLCASGFISRSPFNEFTSTEIVARGGMKSETLPTGEQKPLVLFLAAWGRHTGNTAVVEQLQKALQAFLDDHRKNAEQDEEWRKRPDHPGDMGCGCDDCEAAGLLLGRIY